MIDCWNCGAELPSVTRLCSECQSLLPPRPGQDHFEALEVPRTFALPLEVLEASFKRLNRQLHPDRFATRSDKERRYSLEHATAINDAWRTLRVPVKRAEYLLSLWGRSLGEDAGRKVKMPQDFLMEVLELREEIDDARTAGNSTLLAQRLEDAHVRWRTHYEKAGALFRELEALTVEQRASRLDALEQEVLKLRYMHSMLTEHGVTPGSST